MAKEDNLQPITSVEQAREMGKKGGIASGKARKEKKTLAEALRKVLDEPINTSTDMTRRESIIINVVRRLNENGNIKDLKTLAELIGEYSQKIDIENLPTIIQVSNQETADKLTQVLKDNADD